MFIKPLLNYIPSGSLKTVDVLSEHKLFWNLFTSTEPRDYNAVGEMESPFMWPSLNKALYCGAGEVAVQDTVDQSVGYQWKSLCLYSGRGGVGSWDHADNITTLQGSHVGKMWTLN